MPDTLTARFPTFWTYRGRHVQQCYLQFAQAGCEWLPANRYTMELTATIERSTAGDNRQHAWFGNDRTIETTTYGRETTALI